MRITLDEAVAYADNGLLEGSVGTVLGCPALVVDGYEPSADEALEGLSRLPAVLIGISDETAGLGSAIDVICEEADADALVEAVGRHPEASVTLCQLTRLQRSLSIHDALVAESLAYAALQNGYEHRAWLDTQGRRVRSVDDTPAVLVDDRNDRVVLTLNRPRLRNALSAELRDALVEVLRALCDPGDDRPIELRANGKAFCIGGDLAEFGTVANPALAHQIRSVANVAPWMARLTNRLQVNVHGASVGAGIEITAFAGRIAAKPDSTFLLPEIGMGLIPGAGGTVSIPRRIGRQLAIQWILSGETIDAATARDWGLVDEV